MESPLGWVVREAATNVLRHGDARRCAITLRATGGAVALTVENDGADAERAGAGSGLAGLRERPERPVHVLLADDEHLIRGALAALLGLEDDLVVVAEAASGPEALAMARAHRADVAVLDLQMPDTDGVMVATSIRDELPDCRTMIMTGHGRPGHLKRALAACVRGFAPKTVSAQRPAEPIRTVHAGNRYVDPELAADAIAAIAAGDSPLTPREAEVLELAADGAPVAEIAERAALSPGTVRNDRSSAAAKLGAENRHTAVRLTRAKGWV
ncbi:response regulator [Streptomyces sp. NPDC048623]|uniref:response regulator n=1 Tax=Streptomyces sp. NPDC048623 TaxID=3155761 RepID=UPI0034455664